MTFADFKTEVDGFMGLDTNRRGTETFKASYLKGAVADLKRFIEEYQDGKTSYQDGDVVPFDSTTAQAVAVYLKARFSREYNRDMNAAMSFNGDYITLRRELWLQFKEARRPELKIFTGKPYFLNICIRRGNLPMPLLGNVLFTVKRYKRDSDRQAALQVGTELGGIIVTSQNAGLARIELSSEHTRWLSADWPEYYWDVQAIDEMGMPYIPDYLTGTLQVKRPVTHSNN